MPKTKISEYSATANSNTDVASINIDEGCAPSGINNAIRAIMGHLKDFQSGTSNDPFTVGSSGSLTLSYGTANGVAYLNGSKVLTTGSALTFDGTKLGVATGYIDVVSSNFSGSPLISARFNASNFRMGVGIGNSNGFPFLGVNVNNAANDNGTFDINGWASRLRLDNGVFQLQTSSASGVAGGAITWTTPLYIDTSGNVGIGTSSPSYKLQVANNGNFNTTVNVSNTTAGTSSYARFLSISDGGNASFGMTSTTYTDVTSAADSLLINASGASGGIVFAHDGVGKMVLDSSGRFAIAVAGNAYSQDAGLTVNGTGFTRAIYTNINGTASSTHCSFANGNGVVGSISTSGSTTTYSTSSDYRLKNSITPMTGALAKVSALKPVTYKWNIDGSDGEGFIAHELAEVVPQCVTGEKDAVDEDGNPKYQGIDTSFLVATLTAAIQELSAQVTQLQADVAALKGA